MIGILKTILRVAFAWALVPLLARAEGSLAAPPLARTASTVLLLWERFGPTAPASYEILCDGAIVGATRGLCYTVDHLAAGRTYRFAVRALDAEPRLLAETEPVAAATKPAGPILNVRERGAAGDGRSEDTAAIQQAIDACPSGGTVLVPPGTYLVDHLELKSGLTLDLAAGATLRFLGRGAGHYAPHDVELSGPDGPVAVSCGALISGRHTDDVTVTGGGVIQANGETWWPHAADYRPKVLEVVGARNLFVQGITVEDPPAWDVHPLYVDHLAFSNVTFNRRALAKSTNADGLDLDSCRDALVVGCAFGNQDDSIAIKCGKLGADQAKRQRSCENVVIRDCRFDGHLGPRSHPLGIAIGSEICGGVSHVLVQDCRFTDVASLIDLKANRDRRHAVVDDVTVQDCAYANTVFPDEPWNRAPIAVDLFYFGRTEDPDQPAPGASDAPYFHNLHFRNITIDNPRGYAVYLSGLAERPIENVSFSNLTAKSQTGLFARNIDGLVLDQVSITPQAGPAFDWGKNVTHLVSR
jgi:polygalacturonase